jgi:uncharacterized protein (DUF302 family)
MEEKRSTVRLPVRIWMTGSIAVVMASLVTLRALPEPERSRRMLRASPYGITETVQRIEAEALQRGLTVLVRGEGAEPVIVLASSAGGTPVAMTGTSPDVPLAVQVRADAGGRTQVLLQAAAPEVAGALRVVSPEAADELAALPRLVERALA